MKKNFLELRFKVVFDIRMLNIFINETRWKTKQKTFKVHCRGGLVYLCVGEALLVELNVAGGDAENGFSDLLAGLDRSADLFSEQANLLQQSKPAVI